MQFLYADGTDAHFMDTESYEQMAVPEAGAGRHAALDQAQRRGRRALHRRPARRRSSCRPRSSSRSPRPSPGVRGDTASGGGNKPATLETGATIQVPLFVNIGDRVKVQTETGEYMSRALARPRAGRYAGRACPAAPTSAAPPRSPSTSTTSPARELDDVFERDATTFTRALAYAAVGLRAPTSTASSSATPRAGRSTASRRWRRRSCASRCSRCCTPTPCPADTPIPAEGAIDEAVETAKEFCGADAPGFVNGILAAALREQRRREAGGRLRVRRNDG